MQFSKHYSDLYVLPNDKKEEKKIIDFLKKIKWNWQLSYSDVKGQGWYGKRFIIIHFGSHLEEEISKL